MAGIASYAIHLPRLTVKGEEYRKAGLAARFEAKRVHDHDEDAATLAIAAARALAHGPPPSVMFTASADAPPFGALVAEALGAPGLRVAELRGRGAGLAALLAAGDAVGQGQGAVLVVSADAPPGDEPQAGAAASAWSLTERGPLQLRRAAHGARPGSGDEGEAALRAALAGLTRSGFAADSAAWLATHDLDARLAQEAQRALPKARLAAPGGLVGDAGATSPLLALARAVEEGQVGDRVVLAAAGAGTASAVPLEVEERPSGRTLATALSAPSEPLDLARLARLRAPALGSDVSQGAMVSSAQFLEGFPARLRWQGQRCAACGRALFPPREACAACGAARLERLALSGKGEVHSVTTIGPGAAPAEFAEQQRRAGAYDIALVALAEGPRVAAQVCDAAPGTVRIGDPVELVVRRLYHQEGRPRYGFKARPSAG